MRYLKYLLVVLAALLPTAMLVPTASAATDVSLGYHGTRPAGYGGLNCNQGHESECFYNQTVLKLIQQTPCPADVGHAVKARIGVYSLKYPFIGDAIVAKARCGVDMGVITWYEKDEDGDEPGPSKYLQKLKDDMKGIKGSWIKFCHDSCMSGESSSNNHYKDAAFSETGGRKNVWLHASGNFSYAADRDGWNEWTLGSDENLYKAEVNYVDAQRKDKTQDACKFNATSKNGLQKLYFFPCSTKTDPVTNLLAAAKPSPGCVVDHQFFYLSDYADSDIQNLIRLHSVCKVNLLMNYGGKWSNTEARKFVAALEKDKRAHKSVDDTLRDASYNPKYPNADVYNHKKDLVMRGVIINGKKVDVSVTGSSTRTKTAMTTNTNVMLVDYTSANVKAAANHAALVNSYSRVLDYAALCKSEKTDGCKVS